MALVTALRESRQYDGTNGADLIAWLDGSYTVISDDGNLLVFKDGENFVRRIPAGNWLIRDGNRSLIWHGTDASYQQQWTTV